MAVKIPRKEQLDKQESELFLPNARAAAQLQHPKDVYSLGVVLLHRLDAAAFRGELKNV